MVARTVGALLGISATLPATFDSAGYTAVGVVYTNIGEIADLGGFEKSWVILPFQPVNQRFPTKIKGSYDISDVTFTVARVAADTGQDLVRVAEASDNSYTFRITLPSTAIAYFTAKVVKLGLGAISADGFELCPVTLAVDPQSLFESGV